MMQITINGYVTVHAYVAIAITFSQQPCGLAADIIYDLC